MATKKKKTKAKKAAVGKKARAKAKATRAVKSKKTIKKASKKKVSKVKKPARRTKPVKEEGMLVGRISHYFPHVKAGAIIIEGGELALGDTVRIKGHTTDFKQKIASMQIDRNPIEKASKGQEIGMLVKSRVRIRDKVYKLKSI